jgi:putative endonuclease
MPKFYYVYLIVTKRNNKLYSYVGYSNNIIKRIKLHNSGKGAKFTKGNYWKLIYKKRYKNKSIAMKEEYILKKNYSLRKLIKQRYINE